MGEVPGVIIENGVIIPDGSTSVLEALRKNPKITVGCILHPDMEAEVVFAKQVTRAGGPGIHVMPLCTFHILDLLPAFSEPILGKTPNVYPQKPAVMVPVVVLHDDHWSQRARLRPLFTRKEWVNYQQPIEPLLATELTAYSQSPTIGMARATQRAISRGLTNARRNP